MSYLNELTICRNAIGSFRPKPFEVSEICDFRFLNFVYFCFLKKNNNKTMTFCIQTELWYAHKSKQQWEMQKTYIIQLSLVNGASTKFNNVNVFLSRHWKWLLQYVNVEWPLDQLVFFLHYCCSGIQYTLRTANISRTMDNLLASRKQYNFECIIESVALEHIIMNRLFYLVYYLSTNPNNQKAVFIYYYKKHSYDC